MNNPFFAQKCVTMNEQDPQQSWGFFWSHQSSGGSTDSSSS